MDAVGTIIADRAEPCTDVGSRLVHPEAQLSLNGYLTRSVRRRAATS